MFPEMHHAAIKMSSHAHDLISRIETEEAMQAPGVRAVLTGEDMPGNIGIYLGDKPALARYKVRHYGEPVAAVVDDSKA